MAKSPVSEVEFQLKNCFEHCSEFVRGAEDFFVCRRKEAETHNRVELTAFASDSGEFLDWTLMDFIDFTKPSLVSRSQGSDRHCDTKVIEFDKISL